MNILVFFGGKSCEHDISVITGLQVCNQLRDTHNVYPIYITGSGEWLYDKTFFNINVFKDKSTIKAKRVHIRPMDKNLYYKNKILTKVDMCILCCHGLNGEDGSIQGLLQLAELPYTGSSTRASAICMDKATTKDILKAHNINQVKFVMTTKHEYLNNIDCLLDKINELQYPLIIKPSNLGSSIGINIATNQDEFNYAMQVAIKWDSRVVIEEALTEFIECNCAVLGNHLSSIASEVEQPLGWQDFLSFKDKYISDKSTKIKNKNMPANLPLATRQELQNIALNVFKLLDCSGVARVDFLIKNDNIYVNEVNSIPGSLSNYLFAYDKMEFGKLLDELMSIAKQELSFRLNNEFVYNSNILSDIKQVAKTK